MSLINIIQYMQDSQHILYFILPFASLKYNNNIFVGTRRYLQSLEGDCYNSENYSILHNKP